MWGCSYLKPLTPYNEIKNRQICKRQTLIQSVKRLVLRRLITLVSFHLPLQTRFALCAGKTICSLYQRIATISDMECFVPPLRFSTVEPHLYRGSYPRKTNLAFLKSLQLKTIVSLTPNPITKQTDPVLYDFASTNGIELIHIECAPSGKGKKRGVPLDYTTILQCLNYVIHQQYAPVYIHCINGGQVTSLLVACLRKLQFWSSITIFNEFINFAASITVNDRKFVDGFNGEVIVGENKVAWLWKGMSKGVVERHPNVRVAVAR